MDSIPVRIFELMLGKERERVIIIGKTGTKCVNSVRDAQGRGSGGFVSLSSDLEPKALMKRRSGVEVPLL